MTATTTKRRKTSQAGRILDRITGRDAGIREAIEAHKLNSKVAEMILAAREKAGLTQTDLAKLVGTTQSVISAWRTRITTGTRCRCCGASPRP